MNDESVIYYFICEQEPMLKKQPKRGRLVSVSKTRAKFGYLPYLPDRWRANYKIVRIFLNKVGDDVKETTVSVSLSKLPPKLVTQPSPQITKIQNNSDLFRSYKSLKAIGWS